MRERFYSIYSHGFIRAAVCIPSLRVADPAFNLERTLALARQASRARVAVALFPELGLSAYSNDDLFHQEALLAASKAAVTRLVKASETLMPVLMVGAPLVFEAKLFDCAVVIYRGRVLGLGLDTVLADIAWISPIKVGGLSRFGVPPPPVSVIVCKQRGYTLQVA